MAKGAYSRELAGLCGPRGRAIDHVMSRVEMLPWTGCWIYTGSLNGGGYGLCRVHEEGGRKYHICTHRLVYTHFKGAVPEGLQLDHLCRVRACCNPAHLEPVTHLENMKRGIRVTRKRCLYGHEFGNGNDYINSRGARECRTCRREQGVAYRAANPQLKLLAAARYRARVAAQRGE